MVVIGHRSKAFPREVSTTRVESESMSSESDQFSPLVAAAADGDEQAWRSLVEATAPKLVAVLRSHCRDEELAEEIAQSTFCTLVQKLDRYEESGRFEPWLMRIAMNRLRDEMRRRGRQAVPVDGQVLTHLAGEGASTSEDGRISIESEALQGALDRLSDADREVIHLRHVGGLSFKEIAEALEAPVGTLLARHHRALRKLREALADHVREPEEKSR